MPTLESKLIFKIDNKSCQGNFFVKFRQILLYLTRRPEKKAHWKKAHRKKVRIIIILVVENNKNYSSKIN